MCLPSILPSKNQVTLVSWGLAWTSQWIYKVPPKLTVVTLGGILPSAPSVFSQRQQKINIQTIIRTENKLREMRHKDKTHRCISFYSQSAVTV